MKKWMAFPSVDSQTYPSSNEIHKEPGKAGISQAMVERAAEWGLVVISESVIDSNSVMVSLMSTGEHGGTSSMERDIESTGTSGESSYTIEPTVPRVSQELKDALSTLVDICFVRCSQAGLPYNVRKRRRVGSSA